MNKKERGITILALVITIIVLLILAGITIGAITGNNGLIGQTQDAKLETKKAQIKEDLDIMVVQSIGKDGRVDKEVLMPKLETLPDGKEIYDTDEVIYIVYPEYTFKVDLGSGDVTIEDVEVSKDETPWELAGSGTEEDPYLIESIEDLVAFSNSVYEGNEYSSKYVKLTKTLDFKSPLSYDNPKTKVSEKETRIIKEDANGEEILTFLTKEDGTGFNPIGNTNNSFYGTFDGNGKVIKEIYINRPNEIEVGLFRKNAGKITNLGIEGKVIGGINENYSYVGGIVGRNSGTIMYCYSNVDVTFIGSGGAFGNNTNGEISNCYNIGKIEGRSSFGGIAAGGDISNSYNLGEVGTTENTHYFVGGISSSGDIQNCYNLGNVLAGTTYQLQGYGIGGIIGTTGATINNSYNKGKVEGYQETMIGGIIGNCTNDAGLKDNYYLKGTAEGGAGGKDIEGKAMPLEASEMPSVIEVVSTGNEKVEWNGEMVDIWKEDTNNINNGYPILFWQ